ncbi:LexA family transcriptional regulator [uncultured Muribaculum sp.]|uniref:XRE family transcriptional regulator n=1 Tax=uncultured Muribaculum sp. TaxID=1918613 RepID=UPI0027320C45|nr:LexA family transcriptional regulator [uncultured Muribaculum sp.]
METSHTQGGIIGRIRHLMYLNHLSQAGLAKLIGIDASNVSKYLSGRLPVSDALINRIIVNLNVSKSWLKDGMGLPYEKMSPAHDNDADDVERPVSQSQEGMPVYNIDVAAGTTVLSRELTRENIIGCINLPNLNRDWCVVKVSGESMQPVIRNGGYLAIDRESDPSSILWGQIYVVVTDDFRVVKYVRKHPDDPEKVILRSRNENFDDIELQRSEIVALYPVKCIINLEMCI